MRVTRQVPRCPDRSGRLGSGVSLLDRHSFWAAEQTNVVELVEADDGFGNVSHSLANPVLSGLVATELQWPGARALPPQWS